MMGPEREIFALHSYAVKRKLKLHLLNSLLHFFYVFFLSTDEPLVIQKSQVHFKSEVKVLFLLQSMKQGELRCARACVCVCAFYVWKGTL